MNCKHFIISILIWTKHSARSRSLPVCSPLVSLSSFLFYFFFSILCFCYFQAMHVYAFPYSFAHFPTFFVVWFQVRSVVCVRFWFVCYSNIWTFVFALFPHEFCGATFLHQNPHHTHTHTPPRHRCYEDETESNISRIENKLYNRANWNENGGIDWSKKLKIRCW